MVVSNVVMAPEPTVARLSHETVVQENASAATSVDGVGTDGG